ncbi:MAG: S8 family serine peptidase [Sporichthyaceae bacterium]
MAGVGWGLRHPRWATGLAVAVVAGLCAAVAPAAARSDVGESATVAPFSCPGALADVPGEYIVYLAADATDDDIDDAIAAAEAPPTPPNVLPPAVSVDGGRVFRAVKAFVADDVDVDNMQAKIDKLKGLANVVSVVPNTFACLAGGAGNDAVQSPAPSGLDRIDQRAQPLSTTFTHFDYGTGVAVYVVDSGIEPISTEFATRVAGGHSTVGGSAQTDSLGHGTHVASVVGGQTYGVAKGATLIPVKTFDTSATTPMDRVVAGIDWTIGDHLAGEPAVANFSLTAPESGLHLAAERLIADGVTVVAAAGNQNNNACGFGPGGFAGVLTVGWSNPATDQRGFVSSTAASNFGSCIDLFAPGTAIPGAWPGVAGFGCAAGAASCTLSGTSMAAAHAAGAAAAALERIPTAAPAAVVEALVGTATSPATASLPVIGDRGAASPDRLLFLASFADLALTKRDSADPVSVLAPLAYTLTVANRGPDPAARVRLVDLLPAGVRFVEAVSGDPAVSCGENVGVVTCDTATLAVGGTVTVVVRIFTSSSAGTLANTATVRALDSLDVDPTNSTATETTTVVAAAGDRGPEPAPPIVRAGEGPQRAPAAGGSAEDPPRALATRRSPAGSPIP